jgi:hypothetical protein
VTLDEARKAFPHLRFAVYALEPDRPLTLEVILPDDEIVTLKSWTLDGAIDQMFPPEDTPAATAIAPAAISLFD